MPHLPAVSALQFSTLSEKRLALLFVRLDGASFWNLLPILFFLAARSARFTITRFGLGRTVPVETGLFAEGFG